MAATSNPLVWEFYRAVPDAEGLGAVVEYYDEWSQSLYLASGLKTQTAVVSAGHWSAAVPGAEITISEDGFTLSAWDHPMTGQLDGAAVIDGELFFLRYLYAKELSDILKAGTWKSRNDSQITQMSLRLSNVGEDHFLGPASLFSPGARITAAVSMGGSVPYKIGEAYLDEFNFDAHASDVSMSGRNHIGFQLNSQTFDDNTSFTGTGAEAVAWILGLAGITKYHIGASEGSADWTFEPDDTFVKGLDKLFEFYAGWAMLELPDGAICVGYPYELSQWQVNSVYLFHGGTDVFRRKSKKNADASYTKLRVTGKAADGTDLTAVTLSIDNFSHWSLGTHKTKHVKAQDGLTQAELQSYAEQLRDELQYIGQLESFEGPMRPWLLVGDVASVTYDGETAADLGLITSLTHSFGASGFFTSFDVDSGGVATPQTRDGTVYATRSAAVNGYNRRQELADLIGAMSKREITLTGGGGSGTPGAAAGFGTVTATVDANTGTPSVAVTTSGPDTAKNFAFAFHNLKGQPGADGAPGQDGTDGVSPEVTITSITGGHTITITDADHPSGQSFNVMDGTDGADLNNIIILDTVTSAKYQLQVSSGRLVLMEVDASLTANSPVVIDTVTGVSYNLTAESGRLVLVEV